MIGGSACSSCAFVRLSAFLSHMGEGGEVGGTDSHCLHEYAHSRRAEEQRARPRRRSSRGKKLLKMTSLPSPPSLGRCTSARAALHNGP